MASIVANNESYFEQKTKQQNNKTVGSIVLTMESLKAHLTTVTLNLT